MARRSDRFTYEDHRRLAGHMVNILEEINSLTNIFGEEESGEWTASRRSVALVLKLGKAANNLQHHLEGLLASADYSDRRSWPLYHPRDKSATRISYAP
jgi:hypothetical protein